MFPTPTAIGGARSRHVLNGTPPMRSTTRALQQIRLLAPFALLGTGAACAGAEQAPSNGTFATHGVVEGFYGTPWSHQDRLDILAFMGRVGLADYFYAPKEDPYHLSQWREPYPEADARRLAELAAAADANGVALWWAISPGLTMRYSDSSDYAALLRKIDEVAALGVRHFGLFLDDVPPALAHDADREAFSDLAAAHVSLVNRLHEDLTTRGHRFAVTPTTYTGAWGDSAYVDRLGAGVSADVPMMWTGIDVASPTITTTHADRWGARLGRRPLVWDNYPVNDYARWRLFLGPLTGRDPALAGSVHGILANPMIQAHASMIPLWTLARYVSDPLGYDPQQAWREALDSLYGPTAARAMAPILEVFGDNGWDANLLEPLHILRDTVPASAIDAAVTAMEAAMDSLRRLAPETPALAPLLPELAPFVGQARSRLEEFRSDPRYESGGGLLVYRRDGDRFAARPAPDAVAADGNLDEWRQATWHTLRGTDGPAPRVAFAHADGRLFIALDVPGAPADVRDGVFVGEGDHVALFVNDDPGDLVVDPEDLLVLLPAGASDDRAPLTLSMGFRGFMAKWLADNRNLTFTEFHLSTFGTEPAPVWRDVVDGLEYAAVATPGGYRAEVSLPLRDRRPLRLSLSVAVRDGGGRRISSLAHRNYPANPATWAEIVLRP